MSLDLSSGASSTNKNVLGTKGLKTILHSLKKNQVLSFLNLSGTGISSLSPFQTFIKYPNNTLQTLNLSNNKFRNLKHLVYVMRHSFFSPIELDLSNNKLGDKGLAMISIYVGYKDMEVKQKVSNDRVKSLKEKLK